jgi:hypothetical protein
MFPAYDAFSVLTKGYACGLGTSGYEAFALMSKGYLCEGIAVVPPPGGDSSKGNWEKKQIDTSMATMLAREDEEALSVIIAISRKRRL